MAWYKEYFKPLIDFMLAAIMIIVLSPLLLILTIINWIIFGKPLFIHQRVGYREELFSFIKFRSMKIDGDESSIPRWGKLIRFSSLDELPQLINILRGEMSFVGPRPLLKEYLNFYNPRQRKRHLVKPGITGLAQVSGRNRLSWKESLEFDAQYSEACSFLMDLKILLRTFPQLFKLGDVNHQIDKSRKAFNEEMNQ